MTDLRKAAEMALEALEYAQAIVQRQLTTKSKQEYSLDQSNKAIEALRQALTQPEQDDDAYEYAKRLAECIWEKYYKEESPHWIPCHDVLGVLTQIDNMTCGLEKAQPEQEPVAYMHTCGSDIQINTLPAHCYGNNWTRTPLYTAPPKREWVGLTDEEIESTDHFSHNRYKFARAIEAKLKEKNT